MYFKHRNYFLQSYVTARAEDRTGDNLDKLYLNYLHFNDNLISNVSERYKFSYKMIIKYKGNNMENSSNSNLTETPNLNTHEVEGDKLWKLWIAKQNKDRNRLQKEFKADTKSDGFDTRLGKLIRELKLESDSRQISSSRLRDCSIHSIDRRRRSEALWFVENEKECRSFIPTSKKGLPVLLLFKPL